METQNVLDKAKKSSDSVTFDQLDFKKMKDYGDPLSMGYRSGKEHERLVQAIIEEGLSKPGGLEAFVKNFEKIYPQPCVTKLGGQPWWVQDAEYEECPQCGLSRNLRFIDQIEADPENHIYFGDSGCGYIFQCDNHPEIFTLIWQSH